MLHMHNLLVAFDVTPDELLGFLADTEHLMHDSLTIPLAFKALMEDLGRDAYLSQMRIQGS